MSNPYRAPELDPHIPISDLPPREPARIDDVITQPGTMAALLLAVALIIGMSFSFSARPTVRPRSSSRRRQ